MKTALVTALSVAGVLVAGSAAALVNTQVLSSDGEPSSQAPAALAATAPPSTSAVPASTGISLPAVEGSAIAPQRYAFAVGESGTVTVDVVDGVPTLAGTDLAPGWRLVGSGAGAFGELRVVLASSTLEVTFTVAMADGLPVTEAVSRSLVTSPAASAPGGTSPSDDDPYDDDSYDDHGDDDRDDDHGDDDDRYEGRDDDD